jgi:hypothetical protein
MVAFAFASGSELYSLSSKEVPSVMNTRRSALFEAFKEDHAVLGRGLHQLSTHLRGGDVVAAKACAERVDREAGAHIAFEESFFYPALRRLLGDAEADRLYQEHARGLSVIKALAELSRDATLTEAERQIMLHDTELMEVHVAECGELFGAMGRVPLDEQEALYNELLTLRKKAPLWSEFAASGKGKTGGA